MEGLLSVNCICVMILKGQVYKSKCSRKSSGQHPGDVMGGGHEKRQWIFGRGKAGHRF